MRMIGKIIGFLLITVAIAFACLIAIIIIQLSGFPLFLRSFVIGTALILVLFIANGLFNFFNKVRTRKIIQVTLIIWSIALVSYVGYAVYQSSIPQLKTEEPYMWEYQPFDNKDKLAKLDGPASLKLTTDLPRLDGATALYPVYAAFVEATYPEKEYDLYESEVTLTTTPHAYERLIDGIVDIIFVAGPSDYQLQLAEEQGVSLNLTPIGKEAFVFFVHQRNPIDQLAIRDIQAIYSGEAKNWSDFGGRKHSIRAFQRPANSGSQTALERLMARIPLMEPPIEDVVSGMGGIISETASYKNYRNSIGYSFRYFSMDLADNQNVKFLAIDDVYPTKDMIRSGEYPISSYFYAITTDSVNENADALIEWILSDEGQQLIESTGYVSLND